jgi:hypothetical protein
MGYDELVRLTCRTRELQIKTRSGATRTIERIVGANPATAPKFARAIASFWHRPPRSSATCRRCAW